MGGHQHRKAERVGECSAGVTVRDTCAFCNGLLHEFLDLGTVALAGGFLSAPLSTPEPKFDLRVAICSDCAMVQLRDIVNPDLLFRHYFYQSSQIGALKRHFEDYSSKIAQEILPDRERTIIEIGCNDGVLLRPLAALGIRTLVGVDPATDVVRQIDDPRISIYNTFFSKRTAEKVAAEKGLADVILANNVFAHIPNIADAIEGIAALLAPDGIFIFEVHDLGEIVHRLQYDMIYHEHMYYYSVTAADRAFGLRGLQVVDIEKIETHGGSLRIFVAHHNSTRHPRRTAVDKVISAEIKCGLTSAESLRRYGQKVAETRTELLALLNEIESEGGIIDGYGASGRANTILQYCGIDSDRLRRIYDDAPSKWNCVTPGTHIPVWPSERIMEDTPSHVLVLAWPYLASIKQKCRDFLKAGGKLIVPLPELRVIEG